MPGVVAFAGEPSGRGGALPKAGYASILVLGMGDGEPGVPECPLVDVAAISGAFHGNPPELTRCTGWVARVDASPGEGPARQFV